MPLLPRASEKAPLSDTDPECRLPERADAPLCGHIKGYLRLSEQAGKTLRIVGRFKLEYRSFMERRQYGKGLSGFFRPPHGIGYLAAPLRLNKKFDLSFSRPKHYERVVQPVVGNKIRLEQECLLLSNLNGMGSKYGMKLYNTRVATVLKFLNDLEVKALLDIVKKSAPECIGQVQRFHEKFGDRHYYWNGASFKRCVSASEYARGCGPYVPPSPICTEDWIVRRRAQWDISLAPNSIPYITNLGRD